MLLKILLFIFNMEVIIIMLNFLKKTLTDILNEKAKIERKEMIKHDLKESLKKHIKKLKVI